MTDSHEQFLAEYYELMAELERVCPEAANGLAISGSPPPQLSRREQISLLRSLPDNAGVDAYMRAWYALSSREHRESR